jgi:hypothetical protein
MALRLPRFTRIAVRLRSLGGSDRPKAGRQPGPQARQGGPARRRNKGRSGDKRSWNNNVDEPRWMRLPRDPAPVARPIVVEDRPFGTARIRPGTLSREREGPASLRRAVQTEKALRLVEAKSSARPYADRGMTRRRPHWLAALDKRARCKFFDVTRKRGLRVDMLSRALCGLHGLESANAPCPSRGCGSAALRPIIKERLAKPNRAVSAPESAP